MKDMRNEHYWITRRSVFGYRANCVRCYWKSPRVATKRIADILGNAHLIVIQRMGIGWVNTPQLLSDRIIWRISNRAWMLSMTLAPYLYILRRTGRNTVSTLLRSISRLSPKSLTQPFTTLAKSLASVRPSNDRIES